MSIAEDVALLNRNEHLSHQRLSTSNEHCRGRCVAKLKRAGKNKIRNFVFLVSAIKKNDPSL